MRFSRWSYKLPLRLRSLFRRKQVEQELNDEIRYHLDRQIAEHTARGMTPDQARRAAMKAFAGIEQHKEECRDARGIGFIENAAQDFRFGIRVMRKSPGFAFAVAATLALGIGATTAVFSVVYGVTLRPLPFPQPDRLVRISNIAGPSAARINAGAANYQDWRRENTVFEDIGITKLTQNFNITGDGEPERVLGGRQTAGVFKVLGVEPLIGRVFAEEEAQIEDKVVLSHGLWQRRYGSDRGIMGKKIQLNGKPYDVIGVMPEDFQYRNREFALWTPLDYPKNEPRVTFDYACIGRLKPGVTIAQAQAEMSRINAKIIESSQFMKGMGIEVFPMNDDVARDQRRQLYVLLGAVFSLLLIGCANLANLLVARSMTRSQELVVRAALGANKTRLILQSVMEVVPLVVLGGAAGLVLAQWMLSFLIPLLPSNLPRLEAVRIDWQVLAFAGILLAGTAIAIGLWPAFQVMRWNINHALRGWGRATAGSGATRLRSALVVSQIAAVVVLMVMSALMIRSFAATLNVDPGFRRDHILGVHFALSEKYAANPSFGQYIKRMLDRVSVVPGVVSVGAVNRLPLAGQTQTGGAFFEGVDLPPNVQGNFDWRTASTDYFRAMGIPLIQGRFFEDSDATDRPRVGIIDDRVARLIWPNQSAIGKRFRQTPNPRDQWVEIVGVVGHIRHDGLDVDQRPQIYWPYQQRSQPRMALAVRTDRDPNLLAAGVIAAIHEVDPDQPLYDVRPMTEIVERSMSEQWLTTTLLSLFASVALALAAVGVYGVLSYSVGLRLREIGIRMALGSRPREIIWMVLRQGGLLAGLGTVLGIAGALFLSRVVASLLYGIQPTDPVSFVAAFLALLVVALAACYIPARRAASVDPLSILRAE